MENLASSLEGPPPLLRLPAELLSAILFDDQEPTRETLVGLTRLSRTCHYLHRQLGDFWDGCLLLEELPFAPGTLCYLHRQMGMQGSTHRNRIKTLILSSPYDMSSISNIYRHLSFGMPLLSKIVVDMPPLAENSLLNRSQGFALQLRLTEIARCQLSLPYLLSAPETDARSEYDRAVVTFRDHFSNPNQSACNAESAEFSKSSTSHYFLAFAKRGGCFCKQSYRSMVQRQFGRNDSHLDACQTPPAGSPTHSIKVSFPTIGICSTVTYHSQNSTTHVLHALELGDKSAMPLVGQDNLHDTVENIQVLLEGSALAASDQSQRSATVTIKFVGGSLQLVDQLRDKMIEQARHKHTCIPSFEDDYHNKS